MRELIDRKLLKRLSVYSVSIPLCAYVMSIKEEETEISKVLTDGLKSGEIEIPGGVCGDSAFSGIRSFTN